MYYAVICSAFYLTDLFYDACCVRTRFEKRAVHLSIGTIALVSISSDWESRGDSWADDLIVCGDIHVTLPFKVLM